VKDKRIIVLILLSILLLSTLACSDGEDITPTPTHEPSPKDTITVPEAVDGKWELWVNGTHLRGANIYQRRVYPELDGPTFIGSGTVGPPYAQEDFDRLAALGANYVNISHPGLFTETPPYTLEQAIQDNLDNLLNMIASANMFAVISFRTGPGRSEFTFFYEEVGEWFDESYLNDSVWQEKAAQDAWVAMWRYTAERYGNNPIVVGYDLMVEPNANEVCLGIWEPEECYPDYADTLYDWNQLYPHISAAIREVDLYTPILIGGMSYSATQWLPYLQPIEDERTVYTVHQYAPYKYTHQFWKSHESTYPGVFDTDWDGIDDHFNKAWLENLLSTVNDFTEKHDVPVAVNEYGLMRWQPGAAKFMDDQMELFEQYDMNYALWCWEPSWSPWVEEVNAFNFRLGPDPNNHAEVAYSDLIAVIVKYWGRNTKRPFTDETLIPTVAMEPLPLSQVKYWAYQLQDLSEPGAVDKLDKSNYDMLVLEPTRTDWSSDDRYFNTKVMVSQLRNSKASDGVHRKMLMAYIDIGEAENWRWYWTWSRVWGKGEPRPADWPDYILTHDPDGWEGCFPVAYWNEKWKDIAIYGRNHDSNPDRDYNSIIDEVIKDGFDGIYLDWVEAFENDAVIAEAQRQEKDTEVEMIQFIQEIKSYATLRDPDFIIIQQNAAALCEGHSELFSVIDAISQEAIWYDGSAFDDWNAPDGYDIANDSYLTDYYLEYLDQYIEAGLTVFNCEYALRHADKAYSESYSKGYTPYCTRRSLSRLTTTTPPGY